MQKTLLDPLIPAASVSCRPADLPKIARGFLLSREVEDCSPATLHDYKKCLSKFYDFVGYDTAIEDIDQYLLSYRDRQVEYHIKPSAVQECLSCGLSSR
ncbi:hypothetical protein ACFLX5_04845 [Chloroflexota bacterium]